MKRKLHTFIITCLITVSAFSQSSEKIKGSRNVTTQVTEIDPFNRLVIDNDFEINIQQGVVPSIQIETDDNLHEVITFQVNEGSLSFKTNKRITSKKQMEITVIYKDSLNIIELKENAELASTGILKAKDLILRLKESSKVFLTIDAENFQYVASGKTKAELNITAQTTILDLSDNSNVEALINADTITIDMLQRANARLEGDANNLNLNIDNSSILKAEKLTAKICNLVIEGRADAYVEALEHLIIQASGTTETYIYGSSKIELKKLEDEAILRKK